jgi:hypothetical protein
MDGISALIMIIILLIISAFVLATSSSLVGCFGGFFLLTILAYITIYEFNAD